MRPAEVAAVRIALVTDAYTPQVNGVTTVVQRIARLLRATGHATAVVAPRYPDPADASRRVDGYLARFAPGLVHVHTEGPLGTIGRQLGVAPPRAADHDVPHALPPVCRLLRPSGARAPGVALADLVPSPGPAIIATLLVRGS